MLKEEKRSSFKINDRVLWNAEPFYSGAGHVDAVVTKTYSYDDLFDEDGKLLVWDIDTSSEIWPREKYEDSNFYIIEVEEKDASHFGLGSAEGYLVEEKELVKLSHSSAKTNAAMKIKALDHKEHWSKLDPLNAAYYELMEKLLDASNDVSYTVSKESLLNTLTSMYEVFCEWEQDFLEGEYEQELLETLQDAALLVEGYKSSKTAAYITDVQGYVESLKTLVRLQAEALKKDDLETLFNLNYPHWSAEALLYSEVMVGKVFPC